MMLLRGGGATLRRLCSSYSVRMFSTATELGPTTSLNDTTTTTDSYDVMRNRGLRENNRNRTRARVEGQFRDFLRSRDTVWMNGPPSEAYWLLRSCGSEMVMETTETRLDLAESIWAEFQKSAPLPVGMYNILLQVYHQNNHKVDPAHFLEEMEKVGVLPNQGTLVGILICCCDDGDIEGATRILDQMKSLDMEIDENIYAALITGHCRRGDMESAEGMLEVMRGNGMLPTTTSYTALLCGYADRGDMDRIEQLLEEMREKRVFPSVAVYAGILDHLSLSGHSDLLSRALNLVNNKQLFYNEIYELACKCTVRKDNQGTLLMLRCLATLVPRTTNITLGAILIRTMMAQERPLSELKVMVSELQTLGFGRRVHEEILHHLHTREEEEDREQGMADALTVLEDMIHQGEVVKEHYFYPNLAYFAEKCDLDSAIRTVTLMKEKGFRLRKLAFGYLLKSARESVTGSLDVDSELEKILQHIEGTPLSVNLINEVGVYLLDRGMYDKFTNMLTSANYDPIDLGPIVKAIKSSIDKAKDLDIPGLVSVYATLRLLPSNPDITRSIAITTSMLVQRSLATAKQFIEELSSAGVEPGESAYHTLLRGYATPETASQFQSLVESLQSRGLVLRPAIHKQMLELAADIGDPIRAGQAVSAIRKSGQSLSSTAYSRYIIANAKSRRIGTALELYERMRSHDLRPSYDAMCQLMTELLRWGDIHGAENMRQDLEGMGYTNGLSLRNSFLGAYSRRDMTKALEEFRKIKESGLRITSFTYNELMVGYSFHGDTDSIRRLFGELEGEGLSLDRNLVSRLFDAYINKGDVDGGLELVAEFPSSPPHSSSLATAMQVSLERGEEEDVEKIKDTMIRISGEENTFNRMFFVFLKSGETTRASQLLEKDEFSVYARDLLNYSLEMRRKRKREEIYTVLELLRDKGHHLDDGNSLTWLRIYDILGDVESAIALKDDLLAAGHTPSDEFLSRLEEQIVQKTQRREN